MSKGNPDDMLSDQDAGKQYLKRLLNRHVPTIGGVAEGQAAKEEDRAPPITGAAPTAVKNLVKRNGKVLHLARKLTN
jgi:hypothetical protein